MGAEEVMCACQRSESRWRGENKVGCEERALPAEPILRAADHERCKLWVNVTD